MRKLFLTIILAACFFPAAVWAGCDEAISDELDDISKVIPDGGALEVPYADLAEAWVRPAGGFPATELGIRTTQPIPLRPTVNVNAFFYFDSDGDLANNATDGPRAGADSVYSLIYNLERGSWYTKIWWYDAATGDWYGDENPDVLWKSDGGALIMHVPFEFLTEGTDAAWRAAFAAYTDDESVGDAVPNGEGSLVSCADGKPVIGSGVAVKPDETPAPPETEPATGAVPSGSKPWWPWAALLAAMAAFAAAMKLAVDRRQPPPEVGPPDSDDEKQSCDCPSCRAFIVVGKKTNAAIAGAFNLGSAIKRRGNGRSGF